MSGHLSPEQRRELEAKREANAQRRHDLQELLRKQIAEKLASYRGVLLTPTKAKEVKAAVLNILEFFRTEHDLFPTVPPLVALQGRFETQTLRIVPREEWERMQREEPEAAREWRDGTVDEPL